MNRGEKTESRIRYDIDQRTLEDRLPSTRDGPGPLVSVVVPTHGDAEYLPRALQSVADQRHGNIECLVIDGSDVGWLARIAARCEWISHVVQEPAGVSAARNEGIDRAHGEVIAFLDADDWWHPERVSAQLPALEDAGIVYADHYVVDDQGTHYQPAMPVEDADTHYLRYFARGDGVPSRTVAVRGECLGDERFDESLVAREDPHLWTRLFERCTPAHIDRALAYKRRREESLTADPEMMYQSELAEIADLCSRVPALEDHRAGRERRARRRYGRGLLHAGRRREAREQFTTICREKFDTQSAVLAGIATLPIGSSVAFTTLERTVDFVRRLRSEVLKRVVTDQRSNE
jgi:glycosyltransferase involved in cell wall biosynthesis